MAGMGNNEPHYISCLLLKVAIFAGSNTKVTDILYDVTTTTHFICFENTHKMKVLMDHILLSVSVESK